MTIEHVQEAAARNACEFYENADSATVAHRRFWSVTQMTRQAFLLFVNGLKSLKKLVRRPKNQFPGDQAHQER